MPTKLRKLEIWAWNGNPIASFQPDRPVSQFDITSDGEEMYCIDWETMDSPDPLCYLLPAIKIPILRQKSLFSFAEIVTFVISA